MFDKVKITKKEYFDLIKDNTHYNLGVIWENGSNTLNQELEQAELKLSDKNTFNNVEWMENNCLKCIGAKKNTVDFLHIQEGKEEFLHENIKGKFFKVMINDLLYVYHYYHDGKHISFKCII